MAYFIPPSSRVFSFRAGRHHIATRAPLAPEPAPVAFAFSNRDTTSSGRGWERLLSGSTKHARAPIHLEKGAELGRFKLGSTAVVLFGPDQVKWVEGLGALSPVQMGQALGLPAA